QRRLPGLGVVAACRLVDQDHVLHRVSPPGLKFARRGSVRHRGDAPVAADSTGAGSMRAIFLAGVLALTATVAQAAEDPHTRALAAGYKAAFLCSGVFNAH